MNRWKLAVCAAFVVCAACGTAVITEHPAAAPLVQQGASVSTIDHPSASQQSGSITPRHEMVTRVGESRPVPAPNSTVGSVPANSQAPAGLPALVGNPCARAGKPSPMCPVASP
jgi:hypothetical protein